MSSTNRQPSTTAASNSFTRAEVAAVDRVLTALRTGLGNAAALARDPAIATAHAKFERMKIRLVQVDAEGKEAG